MVCLPARYATLCVFTSNLSQFRCFPTKANSMCRIRMVRAKVVGEGCRNPAKTKEKCDRFPTKTQNVWIFLHKTHLFTFQQVPNQSKIKVGVEVETNKMVHLFAVPFQRLTNLHKHLLRTLRDRQDKSFLLSIGLYILSFSCFNHKILFEIVF